MSRSTVVNVNATWLLVIIYFWILFSLNVFAFSLRSRCVGGHGCEC